MLKFVIDAMGGDYGSPVVVQAIKDFLSENNYVDLYVVGKKDELVELEGMNYVHVIDAKTVVPMDAGALDTLRMKDSSMMIALNLYKEINADAIISCGSTGGFLSASTVTLKLIPGIKRAALCVALPTLKENKKVVFLDVGANNENSSDELVQFAIMGRLYAKAVNNIENPRVVTMANGTEDGKGSPLIKETLKKLREMNFPNYQGNIEAREILSGDNDVVVLDGFTGNICLKAIEGTAKSMGQMIKNVFRKNLWTKIGYIHVKGGMRKMTKIMDYRSTGGAFLIGVNGIVIKSHGNANPYCFKNAMYVAMRLAENNIVYKIRKGVETSK